jgi:GT2 family glycosyltransferase
MPTAIRDVELSSPVATIGHLDRYERCMLVFRWRNRVVGREVVPVQNGQVSAAEATLAARRTGRPALLAWLADAIEYDEQHTVGAPPLTATVAICTRERADDLARALTAVTALRRRPEEILVIDNAPLTNRTRQVVARYPDVRYVRERAVGLNAARNCALREATGEIVAFTDDDAAPEPDWLEALLANFGDPRVLCATGLTLPVELETEAQELFEEVTPFSRGYVRRVFDGQHDNPLHVGPVGAGANMAIRRNAADRVGMFDERLDGGTPTRSGGDHEMFVRILAAGYRIAYDPAAVSRHRHRRTRSELIDTVYGYGVGVYAMWTGLAIERRELGLLKLAWSWFRTAHLPALLDRFAREPHPVHASLARAEFRGCVHGPRAWFAARRLRRTPVP